MGSTLSIRLLGSISEVTRSEWNSVLGSCDAAGLMTRDDASTSSFPPASSSAVELLSAVCPFMHYDWIRSLEDSGCASTQAGVVTCCLLQSLAIHADNVVPCCNISIGWQPLHVLVYCRADGDVAEELVAAMPLYVKYHSQGEFIFDHSWAEYARSALGLRYYPKASAVYPICLHNEWIQ